MSEILEDDMYVTKRDGSFEPVSFDKILNRIKTVGAMTPKVEKLNYTALAMKVIDQLYDKIAATKIDELSAEQCASMSSIHPDYNILASRIIITNHHKNTTPSFSHVMERLYNYVDKIGKPSPLVSDDLYRIVAENADFLNALCDYSRDYFIDYFGFKTLERSYLMRIGKTVMERPQHMWLRVAIGIHGTDLVRVKQTYEYMSQKYFTHATPTLFNAGTPRPQLSSCYLLSMESDSIDGIYNTLKDCAIISKMAGGIGLHIHNIRSTGSHIRGTNGTSNGIVPMLRVFNNTAKYVDQCISPETVIYTTDGPKQIQNCTMGETHIFNRNGEPEVIQNVLEHYYEGDILNIKTDFSPNELQVTSEHPIYILRDEYPQWIDAGKIEVGDNIIYSIPTYEKEIPNISEDDCRIYGYMIKHGQILKDGTYIIQPPAEPGCDITQYVEQYLNNKFIYAGITNRDIGWKSTVQFPFRYNDFYDECGNKCIHRRCLNLPIEKISVIYSILKDCNIESIQSHLRYMSLRLARSSLPEEMNFIQGDNAKTFITTPVTSIRQTKHRGILYDLQMKNEHNYLLECGLVHNGGGKRNGSFAIYLEPWHGDIQVFLQMRKNHGDEEMKARDLFYALWIPDLFMKRVKTDAEWTLMCPDECPGLADVYGEAFEELYESYEKQGRGRETVKARDLWFQILDAQMETGTPYLLFKDAANRKSNQKNVGTIKSSNLCVAPETPVLTDKGYIPIKTLAELSLNTEESLYTKIWNGEDFVNVNIMQTGENRPLVTVNTSDGGFLRCTPYHKFFIRSHTTDSVVVKDAADLNPDDEIAITKYPDMSKSIDTKDILRVARYLIQYNDMCNTCEYEYNGRTFGIISLDRELLYDMKLKLQFCGVNAWIEYSSSTSNYILSTSKYIMRIYTSDIAHLTSIGFRPSAIEIISIFKNISKNTLVYPPPVKIVAVEDNGETDDTYCFHEPNKNVGFFNGIMTSQCTEIIEYSDENESAVCNLASIALPAFILPATEQGMAEQFDYAKLHEIAKIVTYNLNRIIDINYYPTEKTRRSNMRHRPIGIGVQGLADVFMRLGISFICDQAKLMNRRIFETIYHGALESSMEIAQKDGEYETFVGSPASQGILQFDMWDIDQTQTSEDTIDYPKYNWDELKTDIKIYGIRNSLLLAPMPTASTSQILGYNECIEPITSNIYSRRTLAGEFIMANKYLMLDLIQLNLWNEKVKNSIIANHGSIQHLDSIPLDIREKYKTVWELPMRQLIDMAADRGAYICQSQSLNLWLEDPNYNSLTSMHFYGWSKGLKTGIYYLRRRAKHQAQQFTIEPENAKSAQDTDDICEMCSS